MKKKSVFDYVVLGYKSVGTKEDPAYETELVTRATLLATDKDDAQFQIFRLIPQTAVDKFGSDNLTIVIRPF